MQEQQPLAARGGRAGGELGPAPSLRSDDPRPGGARDCDRFVGRAGVDNDDIVHNRGGVQLLHHPCPAFRLHSVWE